MGKESIKQDQSSVFKRLRRRQQQSPSSSSFQVTDQQHKDHDSFITQIPNNNKRSK
jgi:hypothetical protein